MDWAAWAEAAAALVAGLAAGVLVTVLVARIPGRQSLRPPFRCQQCDVRLRTADTIPVISWLTLRGRCRACQQPFGAWSLAAELITAGLFLALWLRFGPVPLLAALAYLAVLSVALAFIDAAQHRLPDVLTLSGYPIALILLGIAAPFVPGGLRHFVQALIGMAVAWLLFFLQAFIYPAGIGWGDVKLSGVLGLYLGWFGLPALVYGLFGAYLLAALVGIGLIATRRATRKTHLAFGPYLLAATIVAIIATGM
jgi:leader peptidase (prepilin peptidase)/N-methyltransferase